MLHIVWRARACILALVIRHAQHIRRITLSSVACLALKNDFVLGKELLNISVF